MARVLFVCLHNAGRSQMSRALFERVAYLVTGQFREFTDASHPTPREA